MEETITILKNRKLPPSQNYDFLRSEGMKHIENLSSALWTDYNEHDPGITILEALCYAITELGYRNDFDIKDLLAKADGSIVENQSFYTAKNILTNNPLTINDYRKLLIDIEGVHNAWLFSGNILFDEKKNPLPVNEVPLFADCEHDALTTIPNKDPLFLSGLYRVLLDLDHDDRFGDLNNGEVVIGNPSNTNFTDSEFWFSVELPAWKDANFTIAIKASDKNNISTAVTAREGNRWKCTLTLADNSQIIFSIILSKKPASKTVTDADIQSMFDNNISFIALVFKTYLDKIQLAKFIVQTAVKKLQEQRNLCEDFISVTTVDDEKIAFCFDVDVAPDADIEKIQAEIFYTIENYLNPSVDFYSLKEMLDKQIDVDEIFNGTVLEHGFIDTGQLEKTQLRSVVYSSDIINLLMDIGSVLSIRNFVMTQYDNDGKPVAGYTGLKWCMEITPLHKPVLSIQSSKILLYKNQFPFLANYSEVHDTLAVMYAERSRAKLKGLDNDLPIPVGRKRDTESYWPVQYDFPQTYGIGEYGLPEIATEERIAQQHQLKAYLMFYEQLLADFFSQLTNAYHLFSTDNIKHTYYAQFLKDIKDIDPVYVKSGAAIVLEDLLANPNVDSTIQPKNKWQQLYESKDVFEDRRSRFLDHMLSRFAESFNDYALLMYRINYQERTEEKISFSEITDTKTGTLKNYCDISSNRGKAYNYFPQNNDFSVDTTQLWDTKNVSGLEKRISFLTGIHDYTRRFLYCISNIEIICTEELVVENGTEILKCFHSFSITSLEGITMVSGKYDLKTKAETAVLDTIALGADKLNYLFDTADSKLEIIGHSNESLVRSVKTYPDKNTAMADAVILAAEFSKKCNDPVGLHLIEHILLRPRSSAFGLMDVCLHDCDCICEQDPYTFRASVVLPYWPGHFDSMPFREYFENKIREEAPAHIMLKICWLSNELMRQFEFWYNKWIEALANYSFDKTVSQNQIAFIAANDAMINILKQLHSEYPLATLHDCIESKEGTNTVVLGKTILGTFKN